MEANELKVTARDLMYNNWIFDGEQYTQFKAHYDSKIFHSYGWFIPGEDSQMGIPLTPEILEKAGFEKQLIDKLFPEDGHYYSLRFTQERYCDLSFISGDKNGFLEVCLFPYEEFFRYRYVHHIQNAFYAITNHHLKIEMK